MTRQRALVALAVGIMAMTAGGAFAALAPEDPAIALASVPQGGSAHEVNGRQVVLVRDGDSVWGYLRQLPGRQGMVSWCPDDEVFLVPSYGTVFDRHGRLLRFISWRDLDAVAVTVRTDKVLVAVDRITNGKGRVVDGRTVLDWEVIREWRTAHPERDLPTDFCDMTNRADTPTVRTQAGR